MMMILMMNILRPSQTFKLSPSHIDSTAGITLIREVFHVFKIKQTQKTDELPLLPVPTVPTTYLLVLVLQWWTCFDLIMRIVAIKTVIKLND